MRNITTLYGANWFYSYLRGSDVLKIDYAEYKSVKSGGYKKLVSKYFQTYDYKGKIQENMSGLLFDQSI